jgi:hypothetical protein
LSCSQVNGMGEHIDREEDLGNKYILWGVGVMRTCRTNNSPRYGRSEEASWGDK